MSEFANKKAVVAGAAGGMGYVIATMLAESGASVRLLDRKEQPTLPRGDVIYYRGDLTDEGFVADAFEGLSKLDYLVNTAGVLLFDQDRGAVDIDLDVWSRVIDINLKSIVLTLKQAVPRMQFNGGGSIVNFSTTQCVRGDTVPQDAYQASKAGVIALTKSIAIQYAKHHIRANSILPGPTETPMQERWISDPGSRATTANAIPLGRVGRAEDMANATVFLLSERASFITGTELVVDGGLLALP